MRLLQVFSKNLRKYRNESGLSQERLQIKQDFTALILVHLNVENGALRLIISRKLQMHLE